jgi:hypothetical protein
MSLIDFLLARIVEDEAAIAWTPVEVWPSRRRVLAECEAKRRIVGQWQGLDRDADKPSLSRTAATMADATYLALLALATVYADHPDYDESWRP